MNYSNGFDLDEVLPAIKGRVGFSTDNPSARTFESFHALCTETNLRNTQPDSEITDLEFTDLKDSLEDSIIQRCLSSVFSRPENLEQVLLYTRVPGSVRTAISNASKFCGLRIAVAPDTTISVAVKTVTLLFDDAKTFNLYLYEDGNPTAIDTISVTTVANKPTRVELSDVVLNYSTASVFYLGYFQDDLNGASALRENVAYNKSCCFAGISFECPMDGSGIDQTEVSYTYDSYGINAEIHAFRDYTQAIKRSAHLFDEAVGLSMVYYVIEQILSSTRSNETERILKENMDAIQLSHYLYGAVPATGVSKITGLNEVLQKKFSDIRQSFFQSPKSMTVNLC